MTDFPMEGSGDELARSIAIQPDGKIIVSGQFFGFIVNGAMPVARLDADGTPDLSFDSDGIAEIDFPGIFEEGNGIVIQPDGKIVIGGSSDNYPTDFDFSLCRLNADGSLDTDFGTGGMVSTDFGYQDIVFGLVLQPDGKILATGNTSEPNSFAGFDYCTVRYKADGVVDSGFGTDGRVTTDFDGGFDFAEAIGLQDDGKIVVVGGAPIDDDYEFALARYTPAGTHDSSFAGTGRVSTGFGAYDIGTGVAVGGDGRITVTGFAGGVGGDPVPVDVGLARYNSDGSVDALFGDAGKVKTDFDALEWANSVNLFDTTLYVAGTRRIFRDFTGTDKHFGLVAAYSGGAPPADEQVEDIITDIDTLSGVPAGTKNSLKSKLQAVLTALASGDTAGACRRLRAFVNEVNAQAGKKRLTAAQAAALITDAERVMNDLGCDALPPAAQGGPEEWEASGALPTAYALEQNSPNPFNPVTAIRYALPVDSDVRLEVYSMLGKLVATLVDANQPAGHHQASFDAAGLASGVYFYRIEAAGTEDAQRYFVQVGKMALIR
jgi:uncharacterized delta-60 repeat protein